MQFYVDYGPKCFLFYQENLFCVINLLLIDLETCDIRYILTNAMIKIQNKNNTKNTDSYR